MIKLIKQFGGYLWAGKKLWLVPILLAMGLVGALVVYGETSTLSVFIYPIY